IGSITSGRADQMVAAPQDPVAPIRSWAAPPAPIAPIRSGPRRQIRSRRSDRGRAARSDRADQIVGRAARSGRADQIGAAPPDPIAPIRSWAAPPDPVAPIRSWAAPPDPIAPIRSWPRRSIRSRPSDVAAPLGAVASMRSRSRRPEPVARLGSARGARSDPVAELDPPRDLVGGEVARAVVDDLLRLALGDRHHPGDHHRAGERIRLQARLRRLHLGERLEAALHLAEGDPLALDLDHVVLAPGEVEAAGAVELAEIAGAEPAVLVDLADADLDVLAAPLDRHLVLDRADRARRQRRAAHPDAALARRAGRPLAALGGGEAQLETLERLSDRVRVLARHVERHHAGLGGVVAAHQPHAVLLEHRLDR